MIPFSYSKLHMRRHRFIDKLSFIITVLNKHRLNIQIVHKMDIKENQKRQGVFYDISAKLDTHEKFFSFNINIFMGITIA